MMTQQSVEAFAGQLIGDLGGAFGIGLVRMGGTLGLYTTLDEKGPITSADLAKTTGLTERYVREWLSYNAASGYVAYDPATETFSLTEAQALTLARSESTAYMLPAFDAAAAYLESQPGVEDAFRTGGGLNWGDRTGCLFCAVAGFFRPGYVANLIASWLPALDGVVEKLERGARVADVGCGHGHSTLIMAEAFPNSEFIGYDFHPSSIEHAREHLRDHGGLDNVSFEISDATSFPGTYDLVTFFDCLHDMGDPASAANHVRQALKPDGRWMIVEPKAADRLEDNINPVSRLYYAASTVVCVPTSLAQERGLALGAQAGPRRLREVVVDEGGFTTCRVAEETPFNLVLEAAA